jgi:hypothetical protein
MKNIVFFLSVITFLLSCTTKTIVKTEGDKNSFAEALEERNLKNISTYKERIRTTENMQNIIKLHMSLEVDSLIKLSNQVQYIEQFKAQMSDIHKLIFNQIATWVYLKQIYQHEVSPPVRILQRSELYLAPSNIGFDLCPSESAACASAIRNKAQMLLTNDEIRSNLMSMASIDPCVNLTRQLKGHSFASNCLKKNKGQLRIQLLSLPFINKKLWLQALSLE